MHTQIFQKHNKNEFLCLHDLVALVTSPYTKIAFFVDFVHATNSANH